MKVDLTAKLQSAMRGGIHPETGVTPVIGVTRDSGYVSKPLRLQRLRALRLENDKLVNDVVFGVTGPAASLSVPGEVELEERKAMAMGGVPEPYLDAWARLQIQKPLTVSDAHWRLAINDAGIFLDKWANVALELQWTAGELFDVPRDGKCGLVWFLNGATARALGPEHAVTESGRVFDRIENNQRKSNAPPA